VLGIDRTDTITFLDDDQPLISCRAAAFGEFTGGVRRRGDTEEYDGRRDHDWR
jgi:hypothetical protein